MTLNLFSLKLIQVFLQITQKCTPNATTKKATETYYVFDEITRVISKRSLSCPKKI